MKKKNALFVPDSTEVLSCKILHAKLKCQKTPKENDVRKLASNWEDKLCDPIHVSYRDGQYGIVEGQKRKFISDWPADNFVRWAHCLGFIQYNYEDDTFEITKKGLEWYCRRTKKKTC